MLMLILMILFLTIKGTNLYVSVITLSVKRLRKGSERSVYWNEYKTKSKNKNTKNEYRCILESNFVGVNRLFYVFSNQDNNSKTYKAARYYLLKGIIKSYIIINEKKLL